MELTNLIKALGDPRAFPDHPQQVEVIQTHISVVFLAGPSAYKVKKPVNFGFLDFTTLEKRRHFCEEEVRLNRRLAPDVYHGVVPVVRDGEGLKMGGPGEPIEWAVKMTRLPEDATLRRHLVRREVDPSVVGRVAKRLAWFHALPHDDQEASRIAAFGRFEVVAGNARENLAQSVGHVGVTISRPVFDRLNQLLEQSLGSLRPLIEARAARGVPRDTHGDLRLDHVYFFPDRRPPDDLVIIDCIEFNERFRYADPVADVAFLVMDLIANGRNDLARAFAGAYFEAAGDHEGAALLPFYTAYRAAVRAKVDGMKCLEPEIPAVERASTRDRGRARWLLALSQLEVPDCRPCLILTGGLPGTGKSTLARGLAERAGFHVIRSDVVRKEIAGPLAREIYTPEWTERTYAECLRRAERVLLDGGRALVDATFTEEHRRRDFLNLAEQLGLPSLFLLCRAAPETIHIRLNNRRGDASDADWGVYLHLARRWEKPGPITGELTREIPTDGPGGREEALAVALQALAAEGLFTIASG